MKYNAAANPPRSRTTNKNVNRPKHPRFSSSFSLTPHSVSRPAPEARAVVQRGEFDACPCWPPCWRSLCGMLSVDETIELEIQAREEIERLKAAPEPTLCGACAK